MTAQPTLPVTTDLPVGADPTTIPATPTPGRTRRWLAGAMLVTVGLVAGGGTAYAFTSTTDAAVPGVTSGVGAPPLVQGPLGTLPEPPAQGDGGTARTDGEPT